MVYCLYPVLFLAVAKTLLNVFGAFESSSEKNQLVVWNALGLELIMNELLGEK